MKGFYSKLHKLESDPSVAHLNDFTHHLITTRLRHCNDVAVCSYYLARKLHIDVDEEALLRGALLHDYYFYSTQSKDVHMYTHLIGHPKTALANASKDYELGDIEKDIIRSHMWPITMFHWPKTREGWLVSYADKICAFRETVHRFELKRKYLINKLKQKHGQG